MEYWHSLGSLKTARIAGKLSYPKDFVLLTLQVLELINTLGDSEAPSKVTFPYLYIDTEKLSRAFIVKVNQIVSFAFPFSLYYRTDSAGIHQLCINYRDIELDSMIISKAKSLAFGFDLGKDTYAAQIQGANFHDSTTVAAIKIFEYILSLEPSYIRYDYDERASNGSLHPTYHFDVNYNKNYSFKIGLYNDLEISKFREVLSKDYDAWYTKPYSLLSKIERMIVEKLELKKK